MAFHGKKKPIRAERELFIHTAAIARKPSLNKIPPAGRSAGYIIIKKKEKVK